MRELGRQLRSFYARGTESNRQMQIQCVPESRREEFPGTVVLTGNSDLLAGLSYPWMTKGKQV